MVSKSYLWADHIYHEIRINQSLHFKKTSQNLNHDFEYRMIAKKWFSCLAEGIVTLCFENDKPFGLRGL
jgi:hypothetical protein